LEGHLGAGTKRSPPSDTTCQECTMVVARAPSRLHVLPSLAEPFRGRLWVQKKHSALQTQQTPRSGSCPTGLRAPKKHDLNVPGAKSTKHVFLPNLRHWGRAPVRFFYLQLAGGSHFALPGRFRFVLLGFLYSGVTRVSCSCYWYQPLALRTLNEPRFVSPSRMLPRPFPNL